MKTPIHSLLTVLSLATLLLTSPATLAAEKSKPKSKPPVVNCADKKTLAAHIGQVVSVEGLVQSTGKGTKDGVRFLNLSSKPLTGFVAPIFPAAYEKVGPVEIYEGKNIRVTGLLQKYKKQTQIKVFKASQIKVLTMPQSTSPKK